MSVSTVRLHPMMDYSRLVATVNQNFAMVENINKVLIQNDETGTPRIILGRLPDGTYGLAISKEGQNVLKAFS